MRIGILDPSIDSKNLGDCIIGASAREQLEYLFESHELVWLPTHSVWTRSQFRTAANCDFFVFAGSNALAHNFPFNFQWRLGPKSFRLLRGKVYLFGVGNWQDGKLTRLSKFLWRYLLADGWHSARDRATQFSLTEIGVNSVFTGCPTVWGLGGVESKFSRSSRGCIVTLTDYNRLPSRDLKWLEVVTRAYDQVALWPQGSRDAEYANELGLSVSVLPGTLAAFDEALSAGDVDYVGTRLHGGIYAMQRGVKSLIIEIDNRAREMGKDLRLPVLDAAEVQAAVNAGEMPAVVTSVPLEGIHFWKSEMLALVTR